MVLVIKLQSKKLFVWVFVIVTKPVAVWSDLLTLYEVALATVDQVTVALLDPAVTAGVLGAAGTAQVCPLYIAAESRAE